MFFYPLYCAVLPGIASVSLLFQIKVKMASSSPPLVPGECIASKLTDFGIKTVKVQHETLTFNNKNEHYLLFNKSSFKSFDNLTFEYNNEQNVYLIINHKFYFMLITPFEHG